MAAEQLPGSGNVVTDSSPILPHYRLYETFVVDNTNVRKFEIYPYITLAAKYRYSWLNPLLVTAC